MQIPWRPIFSLWLCGPVLLTLAATLVGAQGYYVGPKKCGDCHEPEHAVWQKSTHALGFEKFEEKNKDLIAKVLKATMSLAGTMREDEVCTRCHFTANAGEAPLATISCERCHGAAGPDPGGWLRVHADYDNRGNKKDKETPEHKAQRAEQSAMLGLLRPDMLYDIASNCMACHGLAHPDVDPAILSNMLEAGHPLKHEYEVVRYSQGEVLHRFYPVPQKKDAVNGKTPPDVLARLFLAGQMAKLVSAALALEGATDENYRKEQTRRLDEAKQTLSRIPRTAELITTPTDEKARALWQSLGPTELTTAIAPLLPEEKDYIFSTKYR